MDAPLIIGKRGIANKSVQVLASGATEVYAEMKPLLETFADTIVYTGELGTGTIMIGAQLVGAHRPGHR